MVRLLYIGFGGFLGAISRYALSGWAYRFIGRPWFPYGTLAVNLLGCLIIGFLAGLAESRQLFSPDTRAMVLIGFVGSFTTFSTFAYESFTLARDGELFYSLGNIVLHIVVGVLAVWLGTAVSRLV